MTDGDPAAGQGVPRDAAAAGAGSPAPPDPARPDWHLLPAAEVTARLGTDEYTGLSADEAAARLRDHGPNELVPPARDSALAMFVRQFDDFMILVLLAAVVLSAAQGQMVEAVAIAAILLLNGALGFAQEYQAHNAMESLKEMAAPMATVVRAGREARVAAVGLVPGDIVLLEAGDRVPADGRLVAAVALRADEASLTGESEAVFKRSEAVADTAVALGDRADMVYAGTSVVSGRARVVITATGADTEIGSIAKLLGLAEEDRTPLQKELRTVGSRLAAAVLLIAGVVFAVGVLGAQLRTGGYLWQKLSEPGFQAILATQLLVAVSLAVAAVPEGLPAVVTLALSMGVQAMAARNAIVRRLHAVETLGSTTFICTDKTGTLTRNVMTVSRLQVGRDLAWIGPGWKLAAAGGPAPDPDDLGLLLEAAASANDARTTVCGELLGDPTETALLEAARRLRDDKAPIRPRVAEVPFDSARKRMTTVHDAGRRSIAFMKGGPDVVLLRCARARLRGESVPLSPELLAELSQDNERLAAQGYRTLAFAVRELPGDPAAHAGLVDDIEALEQGFVFLGIAALDDPPRPEVPAAIAAAHSAGIRVAMVTGDHAVTARSIGERIGLADACDVVTGAELAEMSDQELRRRAGDIRVYARVDPGDKLRIVDALKREGEVVAMTGDGVNDAPALKRADIGISMGLVGTDVAREASDMILADDDFATIVEAVRQGRFVYDNIKKTILFLLSCNVSEVLIIFVTQFFVAAPALLPLQLLWNNLVTDGAPALALGVDPPDAGVMERAPRSRADSVFTRANQTGILWQGALLTIAGLAVFAWGEWFMPDHQLVLARTMLFTTMMLTQLLHSFNFRVPHGTVWSAESLKNRWLLVAVAVSLAAQLLIVYVSALQRVFGTAALGPWQWVAVLAAAVVPVATIDAIKVVVSRRRALAEVTPGAAMPPAGS